MRTKLEPRLFLHKDHQGLYGWNPVPPWRIPDGETAERLAVVATMHAHCRAINHAIDREHGRGARTQAANALNYPKAETLTRILNGQDRLTLDTVALAVHRFGITTFPTREELTRNLEHAKASIARPRPRRTEGLLTADQIHRFTTGDWHAEAVNALADIGHFHDLDESLGWPAEPVFTIDVANASDPNNTGLVYGRPTPTGADLTIFADADWWERTEQHGGPEVSGFFVTAWHEHDPEGRPTRVSVLVLLPIDPDDQDWQGPQEFASVPVDVRWDQPDSPTIGIERTPDLTRWWLTRTGRDIPARPIPRERQPQRSRTSLP